MEFFPDIAPVDPDPVICPVDPDFGAVPRCATPIPGDSSDPVLVTCEGPDEPVLCIEIGEFFLLPWREMEDCELIVQDISPTPFLGPPDATNWTLALPILEPLKSYEPEDFCGPMPQEVAPDPSTKDEVIDPEAPDEDLMGFCPVGLPGWLGLPLPDPGPVTDSVDDLIFVPDDPDQIIGVCGVGLPGWDDPVWPDGGWCGTGWIDPAEPIDAPEIAICACVCGVGATDDLCLV